jgi:hypothetical protein
MLWFGLNLSASAFGVSSVWMNIVRLVCVVGMDGRSVGWLSGWMVGLCLLLEDEMGVGRCVSEKYLDAEVATL